MKVIPGDTVCGPAALKAALYALDHRRIRIDTLKKICNTDKGEEGTQEDGFVRAIKHYGHKPIILDTTTAKEAWDFLNKSIDLGRPVIICAYKWKHWVTVLGRFGSRVWVYDNDATTPYLKNRYSAIDLFTRREWTPRWRCYDDEIKKFRYYAIAIAKKRKRK